MQLDVAMFQKDDTHLPLEGTVVLIASFPCSTLCHRAVQMNIIRNQLTTAHIVDL
jgi:hypothetical protein